MPDRTIRTRVRSVVPTLVMSTLIAACGPGTGSIPSDAFPVVASSDLAVGEERILVGIATTDATSHASPDLAVEFDLYAPGAVTPTLTTPGTFAWTVPDVRGLYRAIVVFDQPGEWQIAVRSSGGDGTTPIPFAVAAEGRTPGVGDQAPVVETRVAIGGDISSISSDPDPAPRFYEMSLADAIGSARPTVVVFATPAWCTSATCGPVLDTVKDVARNMPDVNFVHVEIYEDPHVADQSMLRVVDAVEAWGLPSEPWVFVVDRDGVITAKFEGIVSADEIEAAVKELR